MPTDPWRVVERRPYSRGVTQLMYVGDDDAVDNELARPDLRKIGIGIAVLGLVTGKKQIAGVGAVLAALGYLRA